MRPSHYWPLLCCAFTVHASPSQPTHYRLHNNDTAQITLSSVDMNRIMVADDTISAIHCPTGFCITGKTDGNGGALLSLATGDPFTFFIDTQSGQHVGLLALPASTPGKTLTLTVEPSPQDAYTRLQKSSDYDTLLIHLMTRLIIASNTGQEADGFSSTYFQHSLPSTWVSQVESRPVRHFDNAQFTATLTTLINHSNHPIPLSPAAFYARGMHALYFSTEVLSPKGAASLLTLKAVTHDQ